MDPYVSQLEVCKILKISRYLLRGLVFDGKLKTVRVAGTTAFYRADIEKYAAANGIILTPPPPTYEVPAPPTPPPNLVYGLPGGSTQEVA